MKLMLGVEPEPVWTSPVWTSPVRECKTAKCQACGQFTSKLHPVWSAGYPTPEILYEVGECCR